MIKTIITIVLMAFTLGLLGETAVALLGAFGVFGAVTPIQFGTAIELVICWLCVLATFVAAIWRSVWRPHTW